MNQIKTTLLAVSLIGVGLISLAACAEEPPPGDCLSYQGIKNREEVMVAAQCSPPIPLDSIMRQTPAAVERFLGPPSKKLNFRGFKQYRGWSISLDFNGPGGTSNEAFILPDHLAFDTEALIQFLSLQDAEAFSNPDVLSFRTPDYPYIDAGRDPRNLKLVDRIHVRTEPVPNK